MMNRYLLSGRFLEYITLDNRGQTWFSQWLVYRQHQSIAYI